MPRTPLDSDGLTTRQRQILDWLERHWRDQGAPPTRAEIAQHFGFRSPNAAEDHLRALARKGWIEMVPGSSRGIRLLRPRSTGPVVDETPRLPLVGRVAAGSPILAQEHVEALYPVDPALFTARPDYLLRVRGWSMRDAGIWDGDLLAVAAATEAREGQTVVARLGEEVTVKRLRRRPGGWLLQAANPEVPDRLVTPGERFEIEGVVVGLIRNVEPL